MTIPISEQIACVRREVELREHLYRHYVAEGKWSQPRADQELRQMKAALATLEQVQRDSIRDQAPLHPVRSGEE